MSKLYPLFGQILSDLGMPQTICDDCDEPTTWKHAVQLDPWGAPTGEVLCENCAERRWDRYQERLMEDAP